MQTDLTDYSETQTQRERIKQLLLKHRFVPTAALRLFAYQYNTRIFELRKEGWPIQRAREDGKCGFTLEHEFAKMIGINQN